MTRRFTTPAAFKQALEHRLRATSSTGPDFARRRQLLVFDRFLARVANHMGDAMLLKGGLALEVRLDRARATKDVDLRLMGSSSEILERLQAAARQDLEDFLRFEVQPDRRHPEIRNDAMRYEGLRFRAECTLAGKIYGTPFGVDVAFGDPIYGEAESVAAQDTLEFAGIAPPTLRVIPVETHLAEKLHAYTVPRDRPNSRVKDLPDIALLASSTTLRAADLRSALEQTFAFRSTHPVPVELPPPPEAWEAPYSLMATQDDLAWPTLARVFEAACLFLDPVLTGATNEAWDPAQWRWRPGL